jgi:hypothetical protein
MDTVALACSSRTYYPGPEATVGMLNRFVSLADELAQRLGCEKIKTIGDCVMAASGLPEPSASHAATLARYALGPERRWGRSLRGRAAQIEDWNSFGPALAGVTGLFRSEPEAERVGPEIGCRASAVQQTRCHAVDERLRR